jgi:hypothetical protein
MRDYKLGKFGTPESRAKYHTLVGRWIAGGRKPLEALPAAGGAIPLTVNAVLDAFARHAAVYYRRADGRPTSQATCIGYAVAPARELFGTEPAEKLDPLKLQLVREAMIRKRWARTRINRDVGRLHVRHHRAADDDRDQHGAVRPGQPSVSA